MSVKIQADLVVSGTMGMRAILMKEKPDEQQVEALRRLGGKDFRGDPPLAKRWGYAAAFCQNDFSGSEMAMRKKPPEVWSMELVLGGKGGGQ